MMMTTQNVFDIINNKNNQTAISEWIINNVDNYLDTTKVDFVVYDSSIHIKNYSYPNKSTFVSYYTYLHLQEHSYNEIYTKCSVEFLTFLYTLERKRKINVLV